MKIQFVKYMCDNGKCGKIAEVNGDGMPSLWFQFSIIEWSGTSGQGRLEKDVCSEQCVLELMKNLKEIPKKEDVVIF